MHHPLIRIQLILDRSSISREITLGVRNYIQANDLDWIALEKVPQLGPERPINARIGFIREDTPTGRNIPTIQLAGHQLDQSQWVGLYGDDEVIGTMAAEHFLSRGFKNFACFGALDDTVRGWRLGAYITRLAIAGHACNVLDPHKLDGNIGEQLHALVKQMVSPLGPVAIFCHQDGPATFLLDLCQEMGIKVPTQVSILGVDNGEDVCDRTQPTLSSIALPWRRIGMAAAAAVHRMLSNKEPLHETQRFSPLFVHERESITNAVTNDRLITKVIRQIDSAPQRTYDMTTLAARADVSKNTLHRRFKSATGLSPIAYIHRRRIEKAALLLHTTDLRIRDVARQVGFNSYQRFWEAFRKRFNQSPGSLNNKQDET